jgi:hypothetical protein
MRPVVQVYLDNFKINDDLDSLQSSQVESGVVIQHLQRQDGDPIAFQLDHAHRAGVFGAQSRRRG